MIRTLAAGIAVAALCAVLSLTLIVQGAWRNYYEEAPPEIAGAAVVGAIVYVAVAVAVALLTSWLRLRRRATRAREGTRA